LVLNIDSENNFWVITESGKIDRFNYKTEQFEHYEFEPLKYAIVTSFYEDGLHNYWIGTTNGLYKSSLRESKFQVDGIYLNSTTPGFENFIICTIEDGKDGLMVGTVSGGALLSDRGGQIYSPSKFLSEIQINSFFKSKDNTIWICHNYGLAYIDANSISKTSILTYSDFKPLANFSIPNIRAMAAVDSVNYIILSANSLYALHAPTNTIKEIKLNDYSFFQNNIIKSMIVDKTKNIWISSGQKGVARIDLLQKPNLIDGKKDTEGLFIKAVLKDSRGRVWVGTNLSGMYYFDNNENIKHLQIDVQNSPVTYISPSIVEDKQGNIWFCANGIVYCYNYDSDKVNSLVSLYRNSIPVKLPFSLAIDQYDNLWIGCTSGLIRVDLMDKSSKYEFVSIGSLSDMVSSEQISRILCDSIHNKVWACTKDNGVTAISLDNSGEVVSIKRLINYEDKNSISSDHVWSALLTSDSIVWFGTDSGLNGCIVSNDSIVMIPKTSLRIIGNVKIMSMAEDQYNNIWLGTSQALFSYNLKTNVEKKYNVNSGLFSSAVLEGMYADKSDHVYAGTTNGLNWVNTEPQAESPFVANVQIVDFKIFGKSIKSDSRLNRHLKVPLYNTSQIDLRYNENNFTINFLATNYNNFDGNMYVYKLEGFDADSITTDSKNRSVSYNNLPSGTYNFWVKASNDDNSWKGEKRYLKIVVKSAPWFTIWAYGMYAIFVLAILYVVYLYLSRETKLKQQLVIKELENQHENDINNVRLRFHTNIAHDIRTPLSLIAGPLEDIKTNKVVLDTPFLNERIEIVDKNVSRLLYLVNQFLDFRRLLNHGSRLELETHVVSKVFNDIKKSFEGIAASKKIHYDFVIDVNDSKLIFDLDKLTKILFNLISNAFKYTPDGGDIFVFIEQQHDTLVLKVHDTGCGILPKDLSRIFDRFYQSSESTSGTGIGLALVKQLVELCKGTVEVQSVVGEGSQFKVTLPCEISTESVHVEETKENESNVEDLALNLERKAVVLVVEDDEDLLAYLVKSFKEKFSVIQGANGQEGFDKALRYTPDIIITDIMMPKVDGIALIKLIRSDYRTSHIPIIVLTAKTAENEEIKALEAGADDFISKPFSTKSLLLKANNYIRHLANRKETDKKQDEPKIIDREQVFLNELNKIVLGNLENPVFSIDYLCEKLSISRMQLHRKIVALLGKSTSEYIREIKLDEAKKYFERGEKDMEVVMIKIGVNSNFHFNKNFKARFGMSVNDFIKSLNK
jgi:signal transduction histidine kinase/ligand-binding sensor domain-containing protein/DNA-binding NarL/FixJ family response regulator